MPYICRWHCSALTAIRDAYLYVAIRRAFGHLQTHDFLQGRPLPAKSAQFFVAFPRVRRRCGPLDSPLLLSSVVAFAASGLLCRKTKRICAPSPHELAVVTPPVFDGI